MTDKQADSPSIDKLRPKRNIQPAADENRDPIDTLTAPGTESKPETKARRRRGGGTITVQMNVRLDPDVRSRIDELADETGMSMREVIEDAIKTYRPQPNPPKNRGKL